MPVDVVGGYSPLTIGLPCTGMDMRRLIKARLWDPDHAITVQYCFIDRLFAGLSEAANSLYSHAHRYLSDVKIKGALYTVPLFGSDRRETVGRQSRTYFLGAYTA